MRAKKMTIMISNGKTAENKARISELLLPWGTKKKADDDSSPSSKRQLKH